MQNIYATTIKGILFYLFIVGITVENCFVISNFESTLFRQLSSNFLLLNLLLFNFV